MDALLYVARAIEEEVAELAEIEVPRQIFRDLENPFESISERKFIKIFRLDKELALYVVDKIKGSLPQEGIPVHIRLLIALNFYASGTFQQGVGDNMSICVSQSSVSRAITSVSRAISSCLLQTEVQFPDAQEQRELKLSVFEQYGLPGTIGIIDCTHVAIRQPSPTVDEQPASFMNRKGFFSINVQLIVDDKLIIRGVNAKFPGSTHDSYIWRVSDVRAFLERQYTSTHCSSWLLGDSGYPLEPWLLTPFRNAQPRSSESRFNACHSSIRSNVERCNGVFKSRFRCLSKSRGLNYSPTKVGLIVNACVVLHNLCMKRNLPFEMLDDPDNYPRNMLNDNNDVVVQNQNHLAVARIIRRRVAANLRGKAYHFGVVMVLCSRYYQRSLLTFQVKSFLSFAIYLLYLIVLGVIVKFKMC